MSPAALKPGWRGTGLIAHEEAVKRLRAARGALDRSGQDVLLVARCEAFWVGQPDLERLTAYSQAGADCLYAPGINDLASIARLVRSLDKPVNANLSGTGLSVVDLAHVGVRRVSVGGALARASWTAFDGFAERLWTEGRLPG